MKQPQIIGRKLIFNQGTMIFEISKINPKIALQLNEYKNLTTGKGVLKNIIAYDEETIISADIGTPVILRKNENFLWGRSVEEIIFFESECWITKEEYEDTNG